MSLYFNEQLTMNLQIVLVPDDQQLAYLSVRHTPFWMMQAVVFSDSEKAEGLLDELLERDMA